MELNRKLCAMRRKLSQRYWLDDSLGCCLLMWYFFEKKVSKSPPSPSAKL